MAQLCEFTQPDGKAVLVNPAHIVYVQPSDDGGTAIVLGPDFVLLVKEPLEEVDTAFEQVTSE
jgi:hypothetical protein